MHVTMYSVHNYIIILISFLLVCTMVTPIRINVICTVENVL